MKPDRSRLRVNQGEGQTQAQSEAQGGKSSFGSEEELLRWDASQTEPPASIEERLRNSLAEAPPKAPWWKRWLNR